MDVIFLVRKFTTCASGTFFNTALNKCVSGCQSDKDCSFGQHCKQGSCCTITCDNGCCDEPCKSFPGIEGSYCCSKLCPGNEKHPNQCCSGDAVCHPELGCVTMCPNENHFCTPDEYCYQIPGLTETNYKQYMIGTSGYFEKGVLYQCLPAPTGCTSTGVSRSIPGLVGDDQFASCYSSNGIDVTGVLGSTTDFANKGIEQIMSKGQNQDTNNLGFFCGDAPQERLYQTIHEDGKDGKCGPSICISDATKQTKEIKAVSEGNKYYCNQVISCDNDVVTNKLLGGPKTELTNYQITEPVITNFNGLQVVGTKKSDPISFRDHVDNLKKPNNSLSGQQSISEYLPDCKALPQTGNDFKDCSSIGVKSKGVECSNDGKTGKFRNTTSLTFEIAFEDPENYNTAYAKPSSCETGPTCFNQSTKDELMKNQPMNNKKYYLQSGCWNQAVVLWNTDGGRLYVQNNAALIFWNKKSTQIFASLLFNHVPRDLEPLNHLYEPSDVLGSTDDGWSDPVYFNCLIFKIKNNQILFGGYTIQDGDTIIIVAWIDTKRSLLQGIGNGVSSYVTSSDWNMSVFGSINCVDKDGKRCVDYNAKGFLDPNSIKDNPKRCNGNSDVGECMYYTVRIDKNYQKNRLEEWLGDTPRALAPRVPFKLQQTGGDHKWIGVEQNSGYSILKITANESQALTFYYTYEGSGVKGNLVQPVSTQAVKEGNMMLIYTLTLLIVFCIIIAIISALRRARNKH